MLFRVACNIGLEGIVSKRLDRADGAGRNLAYPAYRRVGDQLLRGAIRR
jgi:hypothetical protein